MGKYEVTQKEYFDTMESWPNDSAPSGTYGEGDSYPIYWVTWYDAIEYCNKRSEDENLTPAYTVSGEDVAWNKSANGYRLPTEAEWEYACRAGTTSPYSSESSVGDIGWYYDNSGNKAHPVGEKLANAWGLYDMHGNVYERCWDWYAAYESGPLTDPDGALSGTTRVYRSGGWYSSAKNLRSATRGYVIPSGRDSATGFRLVRNGE
jgi:formylglycine-generating enzyme required for sulfatase activity